MLATQPARPISRSPGWENRHGGGTGDGPRPRHRRRHRRRAVLPRAESAVYTHRHRDRTRQKTPCAGPGREAKPMAGDARCDAVPSHAMRENGKWQRYPAKAGASAGTRARVPPSPAQPRKGRGVAGLPSSCGRSSGASGAASACRAAASAQGTYRWACKSRRGNRGPASTKVGWLGDGAGAIVTTPGGPENAVARPMTAACTRPDAPPFRPQLHPDHPGALDCPSHRDERAHTRVPSQPPNPPISPLHTQPIHTQPARLRTARPTACPPGGLQQRLTCIQTNPSILPDQARPSCSCFCRLGLTPFAALCLSVFLSLSHPSLPLLTVNNPLPSPPPHRQ